MDSFNLNKLKEFIPKELPIPSWPTSHRSMNPDDEDEAANNRNAPPVPPKSDRQSSMSAMVLAEPKPITSGPRTNLDLINECDNFPYYQNNAQLFFACVNTYYGLYVEEYPEVELGYLLPSVAAVFKGLPDWKVDDDDRSLTLVTGSNEAERSRIVAATCEAMRATGHFKILEGWRNELYPVYGPNRDLLFSVERAASSLFGIVTYGVHMTAYTMVKGDKAEQDRIKDMRLWIARRAITKQTYGGMLDNTVAGGMATGERPLECMVRECEEEASLQEDVVRKSLRAAGTVTYFHVRDHRAGGETRLLEPECQYVYDLELDEDVVPKPHDDEVEGFELKTVEQTKEALRNGEFKPNCALVLLDFFVRHGILTPEDDGYIEIIARLHRKFEFPTL
ncbi:Hypothetical protein R9X50_00763000 [Acrodontium crateriforme]|uniref:Nudix hydrolase domain-containing protein n=1 Tax=Acrodontium crateriforme TaxID=150365 RepID=A0AAQ3MBH5_9PEZI|nr:Hypothetical protein R9X50_00763000 [Acrodontium crateriforme]